MSQEVSSVVTDYLPDVQPSLYKVLAATTSSNTDRYVHDVMGFHSQEDHNGNWSFTAPDHLGSVRAVYDESLNEDYFTRYAPYGDPFGSVGSNPTPFNFTGEPADSNGLVHLRARYYHPGLGNFISLDPLETANRYGYVDENPINFMDPSGLIYESPNGTTSINSINSGTSCGELFTNTFGGGNFRQQQDYTVCHLPRPVESICKQNLLSRSFLLSLLGTYGISISEGTIQQWKAREGVDDSKVNQRLCEMSYASFLIGTKLQSIVRNHLSNGGTCGNYSTSSPSLNDPTLMFRDILGEATQISGNSSAFGMDSTPGQTVSDPSKVNIPGRSLLNQKPDGGTYTACFYNIFVHELSHVIDFKVTLAAGNTNIVSRGISVIGEDYHYHARELGVGVGLLSMRSRSNTAEYGADALANWFLSSLDEEFEKINQVQEQLDDLMDRTVCGGEFTDYYGQTQILLGGSILTR